MRSRRVDDVGAGRGRRGDLRLSCSVVGFETEHGIVPLPVAADEGTKSCPACVLAQERPARRRLLQHAVAENEWSGPDYALAEIVACRRSRHGRRHRRHPNSAVLRQAVGEAAAQTGRSGISAACAADTVPNIATTNQSLRIATLHRTRTFARDHGSLTLTNGCAGGFRRRQAMKNTQSKTARDDPAPLREIKRWG